MELRIETSEHQLIQAEGSSLTLRESALDYAMRGFAVLPVHSAREDGRCSCGNDSCRNIGKHPVSRLVPRGHLDATTDQRIIERWWSEFPNANIGIALAASNLVVVAPDSPDWLARFQELGLPETFLAATGGGQGHEQFYFQRPSNCLMHRICRAEEYDIVSDGYVVAPPSRHRSGRVYQLLTALPDNVNLLPQPPAWVVEMLTRASEKQPRVPTTSFSENSAHEGYEIFEAVKSRLSKRIRELIEEGPQPLDDRSKLDAQVCTALAALRLDDDEIRSVYEAFPIGQQSKYEERGDDYLATTLHNVRSFLAQSTNSKPTTEREPNQDGSLQEALAPFGDVGTLCEPSVITLADVVSEEVHWLWRNRIPLGKVTVLDGDPGTGKSALTLDLAARVTNGSMMPDDTASDLEGPADVLVVSYEDGLGDTIRPRLETAAADLYRVHALSTLTDGQGNPRPPYLPQDLNIIERIVRTLNVKLVVIDPLMAALSRDVRSNGDQEIRTVMTPLAAVAERTGAAVLVVRHLNKSEGTQAIYRGGGSIGIIGAARAGLLVTRHPEDETKRLLAVVKMNLGREAPALVYRLEEHSNGQPHLVWEGEASITANEALRMLSRDMFEPRSSLEEAREFLRTYLAAGERPASEAVNAGREQGISDRTLDRAKVGLVESYRRGFSNNGIWYWRLLDHGSPIGCQEDQRVPSTVETNGSDTRSVDLFEDIPF